MLTSPSPTLIMDQRDETFMWPIMPAADHECHQRGSGRPYVITDDCDDKDRFSADSDASPFPDSGNGPTASIGICARLVARLDKVIYPETKLSNGDEASEPLNFPKLTKTLSSPESENEPAPPSIHLPRNARMRPRLNLTDRPTWSRY